MDKTLQGRIVFVSAKNNKRGMLAVTTVPQNGLTSERCAWVKANDKLKIGESLDIPADSYIEQADFKGAAQHIALAEQVSAKRRVVQPAQMPQGSCQAGAGEYAAGEYDSMIIKPEYHLPDQSPFTLPHLE